MGDAQAYGDWRSVELAIKDAAKKAAREAGSGVSAATVDAQIRQARYDRFLSRVFAEGEATGWTLKGGLSMLAGCRDRGPPRTSTSPPAAPQTSRKPNGSCPRWWLSTWATT